MYSVIKRYLTKTYQGETTEASLPGLETMGIVPGSTACDVPSVSAEMSKLPTPASPTPDGGAEHGCAPSEPTLQAAELPFSMELVKNLPRPAHATALLPPSTTTLQQSCRCSAFKPVSERAAYIQKEAEFRRCQATLEEAIRTYWEVARELRILQTIMEMPDREVFPPAMMHR